MSVSAPKGGPHPAGGNWRWLRAGSEVQRYAVENLPKYKASEARPEWAVSTWLPRWPQKAIRDLVSVSPDLLPASCIPQLVVGSRSLAQAGLETGRARCAKCWLLLPRECGGQREIADPKLSAHVCWVVPPALADWVTYILQCPVWFYSVRVSPPAMRFSSQCFARWMMCCRLRPCCSPLRFWNSLSHLAELLRLQSPWEHSHPSGGGGQLWPVETSLGPDFTRWSVKA